ncbi:MAG: response regulator transcription factor [Thermoleophilia bacterium]|nr:response regulator transcription factor [Thermoleophilia bacterium]
MSEIEVILADDHALFRQGLAQLLETESDIAIVSQAANGREVLDRLHHRNADVVLMDITMPAMDGITAIREISQNHPGVKVLVLSAHEDRDSLFAAIEAGAQGYVLKDSEPEELAGAIRVVAGGGSIVSPSVTPQLLRRVREVGWNPAEAERSRLNLSDREMEVLRELATPKSPAHIGRELLISTKTVHNHIASIYKKLAVNSRTEAVMKAIDVRLIPRD